MAASYSILFAAGWALLLTAPLASTAVPGSGQPKASIWTQPAAPIELLRYRVVVASGGSGLLRQGVHHNLEYRNRGGRAIAAVGFALLGFDLWNEMVGGCEAMDLEQLAAGATRRTRWTDPAGAAAPRAMSLAIVRRVRFADGEVWRADDWTLIEELQRANLTVASLALTPLSAEGALRGRPGEEGAEGFAPSPPPAAGTGGEPMGIDELFGEPPEEPFPPPDR